MTDSRSHNVMIIKQMIDKAYRKDVKRDAWEISIQDMPPALTNDVKLSDRIRRKFVGAMDLTDPETML